MLFRNLFPSKVLTFMHAYIDTPRRFGWNLRENIDSDNPTLLGLHRGIVLLQADNKVKGLWVRYSALSEWNKRPNNYSDKFDLRRNSLCMAIPQLDSGKPNYNKLVDLDRFPFLVPMDEVCKILHLETCDEPMYKNLLQAPFNLEAVMASGAFDPKRRFFKKAPLEKYLGLEKLKKADIKISIEQ